MHAAGKPILAHIRDDLVTVGLDEVVLVVGYIGEMILGVRESPTGRASLSREAQRDKPLLPELRLAMPAITGCASLLTPVPLSGASALHHEHSSGDQ